MVAIFTGLGAGFERGSRAALGSAGLLGSGVQGRAGEGVSLNASTGNLILTQQDEFLAGLGPDVGIGRTYNSQGALNENGDGWRQSTDRRVYNLTGTVNTAGSTITRVSADGSEIVYAYNASSGVYTTTDGAGAYDKLSNSGGDWTWTDGSSQFTETYLAADGGYISRFTDTDGNALTFTYVSTGKLDKVTTQNGEYVQYSWSGTDVTAIVTHFGTSSTITRTTYAYDSQHRLTTVTVDLTPDNTGDSSTYTTTYSYVGTTNLLSSITQSDGSSLTIGYNDTNHPTWVTDLTQLADPATGETRTTHVNYVSTTQTDVTDPRGQVTHLYYNAAGQLTQVTAPPAYTGATAQTVLYAYDSNGNVTTVTDPTNVATTYTYDANGNVASITDGNGNVVTRSYDAKNALILETHTASTAGSNAEAVYTRYVYDGEDHLRFVISGAGRVTEYQYWANGSPEDGSLKYTIDYPDSFYTTIAAPTVPTEAQMTTWATGLDRTNAEICYYDYDARGDLSLSKHFGAASTAGAGLDTEGYDQTVFVYDQAGRLVQRTQGPLATESFGYDGLGRLKVSTDLNGGTTTVVFNDAATTTTVTTAANLTTVSTYNKAGDLISSQVSGTNTTGGTEYFAYDKNGQVRRSIDATNKVHYFLYDKVGRKIADVGQGGEIVEYRYDQDNRLIASVRYANTLGSTELAAIVASPTGEFEFGVNLTRPSAHAADLWSWTIYDVGGRIIETIAGDGAATRYEYDNSSQLVKTTSFFTKLSVSALITTPPTAPIWPASNANDRITRSFYGSDGLLLGRLNAEGFFTRLYYDAAGRKFQEITFANPPAGSPAIDTLNTIMGNITSNAAKDVSTRYVYDGQGLLRFTIDALNHVTELVYRQSVDSYAIGVTRKTIQYANTLGTVANYNYATIKAAVAAIASSANDRVSYAVYNTHGQLAYAIDATGAVTAFAYDIAGRITKTTQYATLNTAGLASTADSSWLSTMDTWAGSQASNAANRITRTWYSERGDVLWVVDAEGYVTQNEYDPEGRPAIAHRWSAPISVSDNAPIASLVSASKGTDAKITYSYDAFGRVSDIQDQLNTHTTRTYYANGLLQDEIQAAGSGSTESKTRRTYDQAGHLLTVTVGYGAAEAATTTYAYDGLGNVSSLTDARGNATTVTYDKLGRMLTKTDPNGGMTTYQYDGFGNVVRTVDARSSVTFAYYDQNNRLTLAIDAIGYATETSYSAFGEVAAVTRRYTVTTGATVAVKPTITTDSGHDETISYGYDRLGRLISVTPPTGPATQYQVNAFGQVVKTTDALGNASYVYYDHLGQATLAIDTEGYATERTFNARGQVATETRRALRATNIGDVNVRPTITTNALDGTTSYAYDAAGRLTDQTSPVGIVTHYDYDLRGNRTKMTEAYGLTEHRVTTYQYDKLDRLTDVIGDAVFVANSAIAALGGTAVNPTTHYDYDANGNVIAVSDPMGSKTLSWFDSRNLLIEQVGPPNAATGLSTVTKFTYDADRNVTEKRVLITQINQPTSVPVAMPEVANSNSGDRITQYEYDTLNRVTKVKIPSIEIASYASTFGVSTPAALITATDYDSLGNAVKVTDANGNIAWSYYDKLNRKIAQFDGLNYRTDWTYDADGNVLSETRYATQTTGSNAPTSVSTLPAAPAADTANDRVTTFTYDKMGRRLTETRANVVVHNGASPGTTTTVNSQVSYTYNALSEVLTKTEATTDAVAYYYDAAGRMIQETHASFTDVNGSVATPTTDYFYDGLDDLVQTRQRGAWGGMIGATDERNTFYTYGAGGRLGSVTDAEGLVHTYRYDAAGRVARDEYARQLPNGTTSHEAIGYDYDAEGRMIRQGALLDLDSSSADNWTRAGGAIDTTSIRYNAFGEVSQRGLIHYSSGNTLSAEVVANELLPETFDYDGAGRLWRTTAGDGTTKYFMYDAAGNQTLIVASTGTDISASVYASVDAVLALWTGGIASIATAPITGVVATITRYDARNQAIEVKEPQRELNPTTKSNLSTTRAYNAFGEVAYEINALGARVDYAYNTMGRLIQTQSPTVAITSATGVVSNVRPTETYYYDVAGRRVAARDANSNLTQYTLLAGSGYNGKEALVTQTKFADNNTITTSYDVLGNARKITDQIGRIDTQSFDKMGRLTQLNHASGLVDYYRYDGIGRRIRTFNSFFNPSYDVVADPTGANAVNTQTTTFDAQGRIAQTVAMGGNPTNYAGDAVNYTYAWDATIATTGMGTFGGWTKTIAYSNGKSSVEKSDYFDHTVQTTDMGAHVGGFTYNNAGWLTQKSGGNALTYTFFNTGRLASSSSFISGVTTTNAFNYDAGGNLTKEAINRSDGKVYENATATYDALGRLVTWIEAGSADVAAASASYEYDANGNVRRSNATTSGGTQNYWYKYDTLNRIVTAKGVLSGGAITRGTTGVDIFYDAAGQRAYSYEAISGGQTRREDYTYDNGGRLTQVKSVDGATAPASPGSLRGAYTYDLMSHMLTEFNYNASGTVLYSRTLTYNDKGQINTETSDVLKSNTIYRAVTTYSYGPVYALGTPTGYLTSNYTAPSGTQNFTATTSSAMVNTWEWWDGPMLSVARFQPNVNVQSFNTSTYTNVQMGGDARVSSVNIQDGNPRLVNYRYNASNQVIKRSEGTTFPTTEYWYRFGGKQLAYVGNNTTSTIDYVTSVNDRVSGSTTGTVNDTDQGYDAINSFDSGSTESGYVVQSGDTLSSIASQLWGDDSLWYKLAAANGLTGDEALVEGQILTVPAGVIRSTYTANTFTPYDPAETLGQTAPLVPKVRQQGCGVFGQILISVLAIAIMVALHVPMINLFSGAGFTGGAISASATALSYVAGGAATGAVASIGSQAIGVASGIQDKFSWNAVGLAAIGGAIGGGLAAPGSPLAGAGQITSALRGAVSGALTQGIGVATGMQDKFSWAAVAAAGVGAYVGAYVGGQIGGSVAPGLNRIIATTAADIADAATRSLIDGSDFGDNMLNALPDLFATAFAGPMSAQSAAPQAIETQQASIDGFVDQVEENALNEPAAPNVSGVSDGVTEGDRWDTAVVLGPGETLPRDAENVADGHLIGTDTRHVYVNTSDHAIAILPGHRYVDGKLYYLMRSIDDGSTYAARAAGEAGVYNFSQLHLQMRDELKPGITEFRALVHAWQQASPTLKAAITAGMSGPAMLEGLALRFVSPEAASRLNEIFQPLAQAGDEAFDSVNAANVNERLMYSPTTAAQIKTMQPLIMTVGTMLVTAAAGRAARVVRLGSLRAQARAFQSLGVSRSARRAFMNGEVVQFDFRASSGQTVHGFLQRTEGRLTSQLISINDPANPRSALRSFLRFKNSSIALGRALGVDTIELQGGTVGNPRVAEFLLDQGFVPRTIAIPPQLQHVAGETQQVLSREFYVGP